MQRPPDIGIYFLRMGSGFVVQRNGKDELQRAFSTGKELFKYLKFQIEQMEKEPKINPAALYPDSPENYPQAHRQSTVKE